MDTIIELANFEESVLKSVDHKVPFLDQHTWSRQKPSRHYWLLRDDVLLARCSVWAEATPLHLGKSVGVIGHYEAADLSAGVKILNHAVESLKHFGFQSAVGPMDGSTWRRYRLLTNRGTEPPFFLEPDNRDDWPDHFTKSGFSPLARYFSALNDDLSVTDPRVPAALARLQKAGVAIRQINPNHFEQDLIAIHELSVTAFAGNFLYTPIDRSEFLSMYAPLQQHLQPELVLLAEKDSQLVGFIFGSPDLMQAKRGENINTAIAKSLAVRPGRTGAGLGSVLMDQFQQAARGLGYTRVIHALMHEDNRSLSISTRFGKRFRQYTLCSRELAT